MRERWLLQGTSPGTNDEDDGRRRQLEKDEEQGKRLEDTIHRYKHRRGRDWGTLFTGTNIGEEETGGHYLQLHTHAVSDGKQRLSEAFHQTVPRTVRYSEHNAH